MVVEREIPERGPNAVRVAVDACAGGRSGGSGLGAENDGDSVAWAFMRPMLDTVTEEFSR
jgi:hypothetical protein